MKKFFAFKESSCKRLDFVNTKHEEPKSAMPKFKKRTIVLPKSPIQSPFSKEKQLLAVATQLTPNSTLVMTNSWYQSIVAKNKRDSHECSKRLHADGKFKD